MTYIGGPFSPYDHIAPHSPNDVLLTRIRENGEGCWIGQQLYGALSYAYEVSILSPTIKWLENILNICEGYGKQYGVLFNPKKTK